MSPSQLLYNLLKNKRMLLSVGGSQYYYLLQITIFLRFIITLLKCLN